MPLPVSVIIAARNEEGWIHASVRSALVAGAGQVILADGDSSDRTREIASSAGAEVIRCEPMRSRQFNRGAELARNDALVFLHADTTLPAGAASAVISALEAHSFGGFRLRFAEPGARLRLAAAMINARTALTKCPWGDQAQFVRRSLFLESGGFREMPIMEDYELAVRMKRRGRSVVLPLCVTTSGRRFIERGVFRTALKNWEIVARWRMGEDPEKLARLYRDGV